MKCNNVTDTILLWIGQGFLPLKIRLHLLFCEKCRSRYRLIRREFNALAGTQPFQMKHSIADDVMKLVSGMEPAVSAPLHSINSIKWIAAGITIFISIFLMQYSKSFIWLKLYFGSHLELPLNLVMGLVISVYSIIFIGTHLDRVKRIIHYYKISPRLQKYMDSLF